MNNFWKQVSVLMLATILLAACGGAPQVAAPTSTVAPVATAAVSAPATPAPATTAPTPAAVRAPVIAQWELNMPEDIAFSKNAVWVPGHRGKALRIDPQSNAVAAELKDIGFRAHDAQIIDNSVWISGEQNDLSRFDLTTNALTHKVPGAHTYLASGFGSLWATTLSNAVDRIDPKTGAILASIKFGGDAMDCNNMPIVTAKFVWVDYCDKGTLVRIDPITNRIVSQETYTHLVEMATTKPRGGRAEAVWRSLPSGVLRVDAETGEGVAYLPKQPEDVGDGWITVAENAVWVGGLGRITRINPETNHIDAVYLTENDVANVGVGFGSVWVTFENLSIVQRLDIAP